MYCILASDWNDSDTFTGGCFSSLVTVFIIWFWGSTKLLCRYSFWTSRNGVDWQEFKCPIHTKQVPFMVSSPQTWQINARFTISNFSLECNAKSVFDRQIPLFFKESLIDSSSFNTVTEKMTCFKEITCFCLAYLSATRHLLFWFLWNLAFWHLILLLIKSLSWSIFFLLVFHTFPDLSLDVC